MKRFHLKPHLGAVIDSKVNWFKHFLDVKKIILPKAGLIRKSNHIVAVDCLPKYYMAIIYWFLFNCLGYSSNANCELLQSLQNREARIITNNFDCNVSGITLGKNIGWLNVCQRRDYFTALAVYKSLAGLQPTYIAHLFTLSGYIAASITRSHFTSKLYSPKANKRCFKCSL